MLRSRRGSLPSLYYKNTNYARHIISCPAFLSPSEGGGYMLCCRSGRPDTDSPPRSGDDPAHISGWTGSSFHDWYIHDHGGHFWSDIHSRRSPHLLPHPLRCWPEYRRPSDKLASLWADMEPSHPESDTSLHGSRLLQDHRLHSHLNP